MSGRVERAHKSVGKRGLVDAVCWGRVMLNATPYAPAAAAAVFGGGVDVGAAAAGLSHPRSMRFPRDLFRAQSNSKRGERGGFLLERNTSSRYEIRVRLPGYR